MKKFSFVDLFAGCGGLSLGLHNAGGQELFAIEKNSDAFATLYHNFSKNDSLLWPQWLPIQALSIEDLLSNYEQELLSLKCNIDLIAGGPPCQGFSYAGKRDGNDPRNKLSDQYLEVIKIIRPKVIVLENVKGFTSGFLRDGKRTISKSEWLEQELKKLKYSVYSNILLAADVGVPQMRRRFVMVAVDDNTKFKSNKDFFEQFKDFVKDFRTSKGLGDLYITSKMALEDLETKNKVLNECTDHKGFFELNYVPINNTSNYINLLRHNFQGKPNSMRLARHNNVVEGRFQYILDNCTRGHALNSEYKAKLNIKKQSTTPLNPHSAAPTLTTLPDDFIHYSEPRILTVREMARLQSFPDCFEFTGKYTTGGHRRKEECPRYSQVGNAVPPLLAEVIGLFIFNNFFISK